MGKIIKINENTFKKLIESSILNESPMRGGWDRSGRVSYNGNGMVGGSWGSRRVQGTYWVDVQELVEMLDEETYTDDLHNKLEEIGEELYFNVEADYEYDDSVGQPEGYYNIEVDATPCIQAISNMSLFMGDEIYELKQALQTIADRIENGNGESIDWR